MKILIVNSPLYSEKSFKNTEDYLPPLGLGLIYTNLEKRFETHFIDAVALNMGLSELFNAIKTFKPDFLCINIFTTNYSIVKQIIEENEIGIHWIIGGISAKSLYKEIFQWKTQDIIDVVYGDGELIVNAIIDETIADVPFDKAFRRRYFKVGTESAYYTANISHEELNRSIFKNEPQKNNNGDYEIGIYSSRGCPYNCAYCVAAISRNREIGSIRRKNCSSIIRELESILQIYPNVNAIRLLDDLFLSNKNDFNNAAHIFSHFNISWRAMCHIKSIANIENTQLEMIARSGCRELFIGIESGSAKILKKIHKTDDIELIISSVIRVLNAGISVKGYFICGFPDENIEDLTKTINLATLLTDYGRGKSGRFRNSTFQFRPYYGTELYDEIIEQKGLPIDYILEKTQSSKVINNVVQDKSFNFDSGNYSLVSDEVLIQFMFNMKKLNE